MLSKFWDMSTKIISASFPSSMLPTLSSNLRSLAPLIVAIFIASFEVSLSSFSCIPPCIRQAVFKASNISKLFPEPCPSVPSATFILFLVYFVVSAILHPSLKFEIGLCAIPVSKCFNSSTSSSFNFTPCASIVWIPSKYFFKTCVPVIPCIFLISSISSILSKKCTCTGKLYFLARLDAFSRYLDEHVYSPWGDTVYVIKSFFSLRVW